jgi:nitroreductase
MDRKEQLFWLLRQRRSVRAFDRERKLGGPVLDGILEACDLAPSSGGLQTFEIYAVENHEKKRRLVAAARDQAFIADAPLLLVFCANPSRSVHKYGERSQLFSVQDATIAAAYAQLTVYALGLATVWTGAFDEKKVSEILGLPEEHRPVAMLPIGYPGEAPKEKTTRGPRDLIHRIS